MSLIADETDVSVTVIATVNSSANPGVQDVGILLQTGAIAEATLVQTALAASKLRLINQGVLVINPGTTKAQLVAAECTYSGYTAGGIEVATWAGPIGAGNGGQIASTVVTFTFVPPGTGTPVTGVVGGWWLEDSAGVPWLGDNLDVPQPMGSVGDGVQIVLTDVIASAA